MVNGAHAQGENAQIEAIRGLLPDVRAVLAYVQGLEHAPGPVVDAYLREHLGHWRLSWAMRTDTGPTRNHNEDGCFAWPDVRAFVVLDGMGGQSSGYAAVEFARVAMSGVFEARALSAHDPPRDTQAACLVHEAIAASNLNIIRETAADMTFHGQGATVAGWMVDGTHANFAHVGDVRVYRLRRRRLARMTRDHSLVEELVATGKATREEAEASPYRHIVVRALGYKEEMEVEWSRAKLARGDVWLLCSNGLSDTLDDAQIEALLNTHASEPVQTRCDVLVDAAIEARANDNITAILVEIGRSPDAQRLYHDTE